MGKRSRKPVLHLSSGTSMDSGVLDGGCSRVGTADERDVSGHVVRVSAELTLRHIDPYTDCGYLYCLLAQRTPDVNISHRDLPSWDEHCKFWQSAPYAEMCIIQYEGKDCGYVYLTKNNEIGIFVDKQYQNKRIGRTVIRHIIRTHPGEVLLANVSPYNLRSQHMFERLGFTYIQKTYRLKAQNGDHL